MLGQQIKDARIKAGLSQTQLGEAVGVSGSAVYLWESGRGKPNANAKEKLKEMFGVSFDGEPVKKRPEKETVKRKEEVVEKKTKDLLLQVRVPEQYVHAMLFGGILDVINHCEISIMQQAEEIKVVPPKAKPKVESKVEAVAVEEVKEVEVIEQKPVSRKVRKVIQFRCPECGGMNKRMVFRNDGTYSTFCAHCHAEYSFWDNDMEKTEYECPDCGELNFYFYPKDVRFHFERTSCKKCGAKHSVFEIMQEEEVQQLMAHDYSRADGQNIVKAV